MSGRSDQIDEFESMFRAAERESFHWEQSPLNSVTLLTDRDRSETESLQESLLKFIPDLQQADHWNFITGDDFRTVGQMLEALNQYSSDLVITNRHLHETELIPQHSLGVHLDVLTQTTPWPILVLPGSASNPVSIQDRTCNRVMVVTDHISGDDRLINSAVRLCPAGGSLYLCHIEDDGIFERYMRTISKIPEIETDQAREVIGRQLLHDAQQFLMLCEKELEEKQPDLKVELVVEKGHHLKQYKELVNRYDADLLVMNTKQEDQQAMRGLAYSLSVELTELPLLLL